MDGAELQRLDGACRLGAAKHAAESLGPPADDAEWWAFWCGAFWCGVHAVTQPMTDERIGLQLALISSKSQGVTR